MAGMRRRRKSNGITRTSTDKGWTTSTSQGAGKRGGSGYRVTTTHTASGKTVVRRTTRGGDGWYKIEQQTLNKQPRTRKYKSSDKDTLGGCLVVVAMFVFLFIYMVVEYGF